MRIDIRFIANVLKALFRYSVLPSPGVLGVLYFKNIASMIGVEESIVRDLSLSYLSASLAFIANELKNEIRAWKIRKGYGRRILTFKDYIKRVEKKANKPNIYQERYRKLLSNLRITIDSKQYYIDGFVDIAFKPGTSIDSIVFVPSKCTLCNWKTSLEQLLAPYINTFNELFLKAPAWNELKPRIMNLVQGTSGISIEVEPVSYYYTFIVHYSPDMVLPGRHASRVTLREIIEPMIIDEDGKLIPLEDYNDLPVPASVGVNMLLVTCKDSKIIIPRRGPYVAIAPNMYGVSVAGSIDWKTLVSTHNPSLKHVLLQEVLEASEASPYVQLRVIVPLGLARIIWTLGEPGFYTLGFANVSSSRSDVKKFLKIGRYEENTSYMAINVPKELRLCKSYEFSAGEVCKDMYNIYKVLLKFFTSNYDNIGLSIHAIIVLMSVILSTYCSITDNTIKNISTKRLLKEV